MNEYILPGDKSGLQLQINEGQVYYANVTQLQTLFDGNDINRFDIFKYIVCV